MLISCEKCSTTYVLDDALIPPQGAPVQCTRCGHVFTARLAAPEAPPAPLPRAAAAPGNSTMMFGSATVGAPPAPAPPPAAKNTTMMFGTPGSNAAPPPAAPQAPLNARSTMMFGTPAAAPPPAAPPAARNTMMFGTPASNAANQAPPPAARPGMVFGTPPPAPAVSPKNNQTMMFGTPASNAASAAAAAAPPPSSKQTMVFGSAAPPAPPPPPAKHTMVFGTAASNAAAASQSQAPVASPKQTMVFGSAPAAPQPVKNQTMMFGTPASNVVSDSAEETILEQPGLSSRTVLFGTVSPPAQAPEPAKNTTMMFGRPAAIPKISAVTVELAGMSADEGAPNESTVRVDAAQELGPPDEAEEPPPEIPRHDRTQRFAMSDTGGLTPPEGKDPVQDRHNRTQLFAMSTSQDRTLPVAEPAQDDASSVFVGEPTTLPPGAMPVIERSRRSGTDLSSTLPPDATLDSDPPGVSLLHDPANMTPPEAVPAADGPVATTLPNLPALPDRRMAPLPVELPPEPTGSPQELRNVAQLQQQAAEDAAALRAARSGGGGKAIVVILVIVALALAGVLVYRLFGKELVNKLMGTAVPVEAIQATEQALATLRLDDQASQKKAIDQLNGVLADHPSLAEAQAGLVLASALRFDDVQGELTRANAELRALKANDGLAARIKQLEARVAASEATTTRLKAQLDEGVAALVSLMAEVEPGSPAHLAMLRAEGLARGVLGDGEALTRAVAYNQRTQTRDDWVDLIEPEYALNGGSSLDEAIEQLVALKARGSNSTFLRPYVLLARLQLKKGEPQRARDELEQVATMNSKHEIARELLAALGAP